MSAMLPERKHASFFRPKNECPCGRRSKTKHKEINMVKSRKLLAGMVLASLLGSQPAFAGAFGMDSMGSPESLSLGGANDDSSIPFLSIGFNYV